MRAIDVTLLESKINEFVSGDVNDIKHRQHHEGAKYAVRRICKIIQNVPKLDVQPVVHGKWENVNPVEVPLYRCSACGRTPTVIKTNFCPDCGAKNG